MPLSLALTSLGFAATDFKFSFEEARAAGHSFQVLQRPISLSESSQNTGVPVLGTTDPPKPDNINADCGLVDGCGRCPDGVSACPVRDCTTFAVDTSKIKSFLVTDHNPPNYWAMCYASTATHKSLTKFEVNYMPWSPGHPGPAVGNVTECAISSLTAAAGYTYNGPK